MSDTSPANNEQSSAPNPTPPNRAARRGKARGHDAPPEPDRGFGRRARPAQGRRVNPIRRTG